MTKLKFLLIVADSDFRAGQAEMLTPSGRCARGFIFGVEADLEKLLLQHDEFCYALSGFKRLDPDYLFAGRVRPRIQHLAANGSRYRI